MSVTDSPDRLSLALPVDVTRHIDATITDAQIADNQPIGSGEQGTPGPDWDVYASAIEDAEGEFKRLVGLNARVSAEGIPGRRETYETLTYKVSGHQTTKATFTGVFSDYLPEEETIPMGNTDVLPFDPDEGDEVYFYQGLNSDPSERWVDITDEQGDAWAILDHREGIFVFDPYHVYDEVLDAQFSGLQSRPAFLDKFRFAISYRYGILDRDLSQIGQTSIGTTIDDSQTGAVAVDDVEVLSRGALSETVVLRIGTEYVTATYDRDAGDVVLVERGVRGTDAVAHDSGETVMYVPPEYRKAVASRAAAQSARAARYSGFLPDTEDSMSRDEVVDLLNQAWTDIVGTLGGEV